MNLLKYNIEIQGHTKVLTGFSSMGETGCGLPAVIPANRHV